MRKAPYIMAVCVGEEGLHQRCASLVEDCPETWSLRSFFSKKALLEALEGGERFQLHLIETGPGDAPSPELCRRIRLLDREAYLVLLASGRISPSGYSLGFRDYLIKPFSDEAFYRVLERAALKAPIYSLMLRGTGKRLALGDILYLESFGRKLVIRTRGERYEIYGSIEKEERRLSGRGFVRIHRSYLLNLEAVEGLQGNQILLQNGELLPLSRLRRKRLHPLLRKENAIGDIGTTSRDNPLA